MVLNKQHGFLNARAIEKLVAHLIHWTCMLFKADKEVTCRITFTILGFFKLGAIT